MLDAKLIRIGSRNYSTVKISIPDNILHLFKEIKVEIVEMDDLCSIYFIDKSGKDIVSQTIKNNKNQKTMSDGFTTAVNKLIQIINGA